MVRRCELFGETVACVQWQGRFFVTGTDVVRTLVWRFRLMGLPVADRKKFEEGVFSDLRNLKPGVGAVLEEPHSRFLDLLYKLNCIRTQKKQKVFFWAAVPVLSGMGPREGATGRGQGKGPGEGPRGRGTGKDGWPGKRRRVLRWPRI